MHWVLAVDDSCPTQSKNRSVPWPPGATTGPFGWLQLLPSWRAWPFLLSKPSLHALNSCLPPFRSHPSAHPQRGLFLAHLLMAVLLTPCCISSWLLSLLIASCLSSHQGTLSPLLKCARHTAGIQSYQMKRLHSGALLHFPWEGSLIGIFH